MWHHFPAYITNNIRLIYPGSREKNRYLLLSIITKCTVNPEIIWKISFLSIISIILFCLVTLTVRKQMVTVQRKDDPQEEFWAQYTCTAKRRLSRGSPYLAKYQVNRNSCKRELCPLVLMKTRTQFQHAVSGKWGWTMFENWPSVI